VPRVRTLHVPVRRELSQAHLLDQLHAAGMASQAGWLTFRCTVPACARMASAAAPNCIGRTAERTPDFTGAV
jgi:hypothetical protein